MAYMWQWLRWCHPSLQSWAFGILSFRQKINAWAQYNYMAGKCTQVWAAKCQQSRYASDSNSVFVPYEYEFANLVNSSLEIKIVKDVLIPLESSLFLMNQSNPKIWAVRFPALKQQRLHACMHEYWLMKGIHAYWMQSKPYYMQTSLG